ncbi:hypothetical protein AB4259_11680 [Vibrio amylolyticus]|uniref:hypothetical protein n=1 Tax=Vibrio amylolyticus TaxID=2847292 RepID=UPI00355025A9
MANPENITAYGCKVSYSFTRDAVPREDSKIHSDSGYMYIVERKEINAIISGGTLFKSKSELKTKIPHIDDLFL